MAICKIKDLSTRIGKVIPSIEGKIVSVFPPKEGRGQHGDWKLQNIVIEDDTGKTQVTLSSLEMVSELSKGRNIYFESVGTKFGLKGVTCEESSYIDKKSGSPVTKVGLKVTKTALIKLEGSDIVQNSPEDGQDFRIKVGSTVPGATHTLEIKRDEAGMLKDALNNKTRAIPPTTKQNVSYGCTAPNLGDQLRRYEVLYQMCLNHAYKIKNPNVPKDFILHDNNVKDIASCFFIQSIKDGLLSQVAIGDFKNPELETEDCPF